jgi:hypothetical protein
MSYMIIRVLVILLIAGGIYLGIRRIWRDWTGQFKAVDEARRKRDLKERKRADVIDLKRNDDGIFRPGDDENSR